MRRFVLLTGSLLRRSKMFIALKKSRASQERYVSRGITKHILLLTDRSRSRNYGYKHAAPMEQRLRPNWITTTCSFQHCSFRWFAQRWSILLLILMSLLLLTQVARADGGVVMCQRTSAPFNITLFSSEMPLRPGPADLSILLEQSDGHTPILDAQVVMELQHESGMFIQAQATRSLARNKLLYCSPINLPTPGHWKIRLHIKRGGTTAELLSDLIVAAPKPVLLSHLELIAVPPIMIILFVINQRLRERQQS